MSFSFRIGDFLAVSELAIAVLDQLHHLTASHTSIFYTALIQDIDTITSTHLGFQHMGLNKRTEDEIACFKTENERVSGVLVRVQEGLGRSEDDLRLSSPRWVQSQLLQCLANLKVAKLKLQGYSDRVLVAEHFSNCYGEFGYFPALYSFDPSKHTPRSGIFQHLQILYDSALHSIGLCSRRPCLIIAAMIATFLTLSLFLGVFFTVNKQYGYSMGDSFTLASYVVAVGAFSFMSIVAW